MSIVESKQHFLAYVQRNHFPQSKTAVLERHYQTIKREMERNGTWRRDARFLDVGCGLGLYTEYWQSRGLKVTGVDIDPDQISLARNRAEVKDLNIRYETAAAECLPFEEQAFDIVFANSILEHVTHWEHCLGEWIRVLTPGGLLWIETTDVLCPRQGEFRWCRLYSWWPGFMKHITVKLARGPLPSLANYSPCPAQHWFSYFQLRAVLEAQSLSVRDRFDCMDLAKAGLAKRMTRKLALANKVGRGLAYVLVSPLVILAVSPPVRRSAMNVAVHGRALDHVGSGL